jgi:uncharacterized membrane protein SpoIIM required for sporulation/uncharacterized RDD family membrane protein YckC
MSSAPPSPSQRSTLDPLLHREVRVETPEHVVVGYALADLGSRFLALLLDLLLITMTILALVLGAFWAVGQLGAVPEIVASWGLALLILINFALVWGYFVYFEAVRDGQTPGKRAVGIRVVHDGGYPLTLRGAAVRNLLRVIDIQPIPSWIVGGVTMMLRSDTKRIGDIAAGTIVVRERTAAALPELPAAPRERAAGPPRLSHEEMALLARYVERRESLAPAVRTRIAAQLADRLAPHLESIGGLTQGNVGARLLALYDEEAPRHSGRETGAVPESAQAIALVERQREQWNEYNALLQRAQKQGLERLGEAQVRRFGSLYRGIAADLARARTYGASPDLVYSLERWVGAGHNLLYRPPRRSWRAAAEWFAAGFPALVRRRWQPIALAAVLFFGPSAATYAAVRLDPLLSRTLVPAEMMARAEQAPQLQQEGRGYVEIPEIAMPVFATGIIANNVQVTFLAFAGGILAGLGTLLVLVFNGVHLGSVAAVFANHGASLHLWTFVAPHGVLELTAICIAGGAGLWLGSAFVLPGRRTRREALVERGRESVGLIFGTTLLLVAAGTIEGFISPAPLPAELKFAVSAVSGVLLFYYLLRAGRGISEGAASGTPRREVSSRSST